MQALVRSKVINVALLMLASFIPLALFMNLAHLYVVVGSILFTTSIAVLIAYWPALRIAINYSVDELSYVDLATLAIVLMFVSTSFREMYVTFYRVVYVEGLGRDDEYFMALSFFRYVGALGAFLFLAARKVQSGNSILDRIGWPHAVLAVIAGVIISVALVSVRIYYH